MVSFYCDPISHYPEMVRNSFLFLCFTSLQSPRHSSVNDEILMMPLVIKHFYLTNFFNSSLQVDNRFLPIPCLVLSVSPTLAALVKFVYFILTTTLSDRCLLFPFFEKKGDREDKQLPVGYIATKQQKQNLNSGGPPVKTQLLSPWG